MTLGADGISVPFPIVPVLWANRGPAVMGQIRRMTDVANTIMMGDGTYWRVIARQSVVMDTVLASGITSVSEQILKQYTIPAGLLRACKYFTVRVLYCKDGATDSATTRVRLGTSGTTADASLFAQSTGLGTTSRSVSIGGNCFVLNSTTLRLLGTQNGSSEWTSSASSVAYPVDVTVPDIDANALTFSITMTMSGTTNTPQVPHVLLELDP